MMPLPPTEVADSYGMIRKVCSGIPKRSCPIKELKRHDDSTKSHRALVLLHPRAP
jgi:hypothetical protein